MLMTLQGRERTATEFEDLLAHSGFHLNRILPPPASTSVIEAEAACPHTRCWVGPCAV